MRGTIYGLLDHPSNLLGTYQGEAPDGTWTGRFDDRAWGKAANLFCYFTNMESGERCRLSMFFDKEYRPANGGPAMDEEPLGKLFKITTGYSKKGFARFIMINPIDPTAST